VVPPEEEVPLEEEEFPAPAIVVPQGPPIVVPLEEEEVLAAPLIMVPPKGRGWLVPVPAMVGSSPFFFLSKMQEILLTLFSHKHDRFEGLEPDLC
jgi:hypothetical protein